MPLVDLATAKMHLRVDDAAEDTIIALYIGAAQGLAVEYLNRNVYASQAELDAANEAPPAVPMVVNDTIRAAILLLVGHLFANREEASVGLSVAALPVNSRVLLQPYRVGLGV